MNRLTVRLLSPDSSGVFRSPRAQAIEEAARAAGLSISRIRLAAKAPLLGNIAAALDFPASFGGNWDALEDSLSDLSWRGGKGEVLLFEDVAAMPRDDLDVLLDVLRSAAEFWAGEQRPFFAIFIDPQGALHLPPLGP